MGFQSPFIPFLSIDLLRHSGQGMGSSHQPRLLDWEYRTALAGWIPYPLGHLGTSWHILAHLGTSWHILVLQWYSNGTPIAETPNCWITCFQIITCFQLLVPKPNCCFQLHNMFQIHGRVQETPWGAASPTISASSAMASQTSDQGWSRLKYADSIHSDM